jgi:hypothetical protein
MLSLNSFTKKNLKLFKNNTFNVSRSDIISNFFNDIKESFQSFNNEDYQYNIYEISNTNDKMLTDEKHFPLYIKIRIKEILNYVYNVEFVIDNRNIQIFLFTDNEGEINKKYIMMAIVWLKIVSKYSSNRCTKYLNIYLYLTDVEKKLPSKGNLDVEHVNSGFSMAGCLNKNEITIFRKEEWFKVFIHETIHAFNLHFDLSVNDMINNNLKKKYNLDIDYCSFEAYCECWAILWNSMFHAYLKSKSFDDFLNKFISIYNAEYNFTNNQCSKLLRHIGFDNNLYKKDYKENTAVFSYFFLKRNLLFNIDDFLNFCSLNNNPILNFKTNHDNIESFLQIISNNSGDNIIILDDDNNRMSLFEFE